MTDFFERPILNSPYEYPARHWELDEEGQPTQVVIESRREAKFITPIPKPKKRRAQSELALEYGDESHGVSAADQRYDPTSVINAVRKEVDDWRTWPNLSDWKVTPETARLRRSSVGLRRGSWNTSPCCLSEPCVTFVTSTRHSA
ncbi:MAG: hypothetical protein DHS20C21_24550 [Gemmatimonadota bacterium]|nr:MAG: hypothetical protein DHS20C21_24550 [Gemmatimonadota bacterium]